jgi:SAM-dependent methyltransferase
VQRLAGAHELLDGPLDDADALAGNLRDLRRINRWLGGARLSLDALLAFAGRGGAESLLVLDVGTGGADIPLAVRRGWPARAPAPRFVGLDSRAEVLEAARAIEPALGRTGEIELVVGDGRSLPWPDGAFDVGHASLVLHHLEPGDAVAFLRELRRVSRLGVIVNDLDRARIHWFGAVLMGRLFTRNRLTRHDAPMSVRRAYTLAEMRGLLRESGLRPVAVRRGFLRHRYAISAVPLASENDVPTPHG